MYKKIIILLVLSFLFPKTVVTVGKRVYSEEEFFSKIKAADWNRSNDQQKNKILHGFIKRELVIRAAAEMDFFNDPALSIKLRDRSHMALVNATYEELVARPLVPEDQLSLARKNVKEERLLHHILIGFSGSRLKPAPNITKDQAFLEAQRIKRALNDGSLFSELAINLSDDPSVEKNAGALGWLGWGRTTQTFQEAAFNLASGEVSSPVLTKYGYHIIFCEGTRGSEYAGFEPEELEEIVYTVTRSSISPLLRDAAIKYDSTRLVLAGLVFNNEALDKILNLINDQQIKNRVVGQYKTDLVGLFEGATDIGVVAIIGGRGYGLKWFANALKIVPPSRRPKIQTRTGLVSALKTTLLQDLAKIHGTENNVSGRKSYQNQIEEISNSLLYDSYLKWLVNTAPKPDSLQVMRYYNDNKALKYFEPEKVRVRELRVDSKLLIDSLFVSLENGTDFVKLASSFSKTRPSDGGQMDPFPLGKYNDMGLAAFDLEAGDFSSVVENLDRSYSIVYLQEKIPPQPAPLSKVYSRISSLLTRELQEKSKKDGVEGLYEKYSVSTNDGFFELANE